MTRTYWDIETDANGTLRASALLDRVPQYRRGATETFVFRFDRAVPSPTSGGSSRWGEFSYGTARYNGLTAASSVYTTLRDYLDYGTPAATGTDINGEPWYRPQVPTRADYTSPLVELVPNGDLAGDHPALWGVVVDGDDETRPTGTAFTVSLEVFVLGESSNYPSRSDATNEFKA